MKKTLDEEGKNNGWRVGLTGAASVLRSVIDMAIYLLVSPIILRNLGLNSYGIYLLCQKMSLFGGVANLGATSYLKIRLNRLSSGPDDESKREAVGDCIVQWAILLPVMFAVIGIGCILLSQGSQLMARDIVGIALLLSAVPVAQFLSIPSIALFCANFGYRSSGTAIIAAGIGGAITVAAVQAGAGLLGPAAGAYAAMAISSYAAHLQARKSLSWYGIKWRSWRSMASTIRSSVAAAVASLAYLGLQQFEVLTIGLTLSPSLLAKILISGTLVRLLEVLARTASQALIPNVGEAIAKGNLVKVAADRASFRKIVTAVFSSTAMIILLLSEPMIGIWLQTTNAYVSAELVAVLIVIAYVRVLMQFDGQLLDQADHFYPKTFGTALALVVGYGSAAFMVGLGASLEALCATVLVILVLYGSWQEFYLKKTTGISGEVWLPFILIFVTFGALGALEFANLFNMEIYERFAGVILFEVTVLAIIYKLCDIPSFLRSSLGMLSRGKQALRSAILRGGQAG
jgi:O-antigen/teichoic acid export membrane protein